MEQILEQDYLAAKELIKLYEKQQIKEPPPYVIDKVYKTKFATREEFLLKEVQYTPQGKIYQFKGIYQNHKELGICPLGADRLINE